MRLVIWVSLLLVILSAARADAARGVTVYLDRDGFVDRDDGVAIPRFGGGDRAWAGMVACVEEQFAPFQIDIVDRRPARGDYITAVVGGRASMLGLDDRTTNGVGPVEVGHVLRTATVFVFSKLGTGERDVANVCAATAHEVGHALGLDHEYKCGDVMSYFLDRCGPRRFMDADAPCGEHAPRRCGNNARTQNSYRYLAQTLGLREREPDAEPAPDDGWFDDDPYFR